MVDVGQMRLEGNTTLRRVGDATSTVNLQWSLLLLLLVVVVVVVVIVVVPIPVSARSKA